MGQTRLVIITGLSGAGKTEAVRAFEDMGYFCVDNLPATLIPKFAELCAQSDGKVNRVAIVVDIRSGEFFDSLYEALESLETMPGLDVSILFLEASDEVLVRRYKESRRRHPLGGQGGVLEGIQVERRRLDGLKGRASRIIDTSAMGARDLRAKIGELYGGEEAGKLSVAVVSFGFKHGVPMDADLVFDVRFLPNPHYVPDLKDLRGDDPAVVAYVMRSSVTRRFLQKLFDMMVFLMPHYVKEGKTQLVVAVGCTGGRHRSVTIATKLWEFMRSRGYPTSLAHRDVEAREA